MLIDADYVLLGYPDPEGAYLFYNDQSVPPHLFDQHFGVCVSAYHKHPYYASQEKGREHQERSLSSLVLRQPKADEKYRISTYEAFTTEELAIVVDPDTASRSDRPLFGLVKRSALYEQTKRALLVDSESKTMDTPSFALLPDIRVSLVYCDTSFWNTSWCAWELEKDIERWKAEGRSPRSIRFRRVEGANHFVSLIVSLLFETLRYLPSFSFTGMIRSCS